MKLKYEGYEFQSEKEMVNTLLNEANEKIIRIDIGEIANVEKERNYVKFRLMHIERTLSKEVICEVRSMFNSLWSQLYRLEHQGGYTHPYLYKIIRIINSGKRNSSS